MQVTCVVCGELIECPLAGVRERLDLVCPRCGGLTTLRSLGGQPGRPGPAPAAGPSGEEPDTRSAHPRPDSAPEEEATGGLDGETLFQPGLTFQGLLAGVFVPEPPPREPQESQQEVETTETVEPEATLRSLGGQPGRPGPAPAAGQGGEEPDTRSAHPRPDSAPDEEAAGWLDGETLFQPGLTFQGLLAGELVPEPPTREPQESQQEVETTETVEPEAIAERPLMPPQVEVFFLALGAEPGRQRLPLTQARTVVGRKGCDLDLPDRGVSSPHFRVDAMGNEFYIQDLGSHNGTYLNGRSIRYCQLLPGDEVRAGRVTLVFRTAGDGLSARAAVPPG